MERKRERDGEGVGKRDREGGMKIKSDHAHKTTPSTKNTQHAKTLYNFSFAWE